MDVMAIQRKKKQLIDLYQEYPRSFWTLMVVAFIDRLGSALLFPFFALYLTSKFGVSMTQVGVLFATFSISGFIGTSIGGALTDRLGRKVMVIFGLITSSVSAVLMGLVDSVQAFFLLALIVGLLSNSAGPAHQAMITDLLPEKKRAEGFGLFRIIFNLAVVIGPAIGGLLATRSYFLLFITDAVISLISAGIVYRYIPETKPEPLPGTPVESMLGTFRGYTRVLKDRLFVFFIFALILTGLVYMNMNTTLGVFLRDVYSVPESGYGLILSLNAAMVVIFQFPITRRIEGKSPMLIMAMGAAFYAIGFAMYGFVSAYVMFLIAMVILTIGEMLIAPVSQALTAQMAPEDMRGRYMAVFSISWSIPFAIGPLLAGLVLDNTNPDYLWYLAGIIGFMAVFSFLWLNRRIQKIPSMERPQPAD
jgi:MFS family permease